MATVKLTAGKERPVQQRHPWVFSGAIANVKGFVGRGDSIDVTDSKDDWLARGTWSSGSQIRVRLMSWVAEETIDTDLLRSRIARAAASRRQLGLLTPDGACRVVFAESDGLPGLIVDHYAGWLVVQLLTQGMDARRETLVALLVEALAPQGIYERSDAEVRAREDLPPAEGVLWGAEPPADLLVAATGWSYTVDVREGQKTGAYLDQDRNRRRMAPYCASADVLDCFCYTGGFSIAAARAGATSIVAVDSSGPALETLHANAARNDATGIEVVEADVFKLLRQYRHEGRQFDVVILDPPKFAQSNGQIERATRGYKDINLIAMQILRPGGVLVSFSCSGLVSADLFQKVVFGAALDAQRDVQVIERLTQSPDHPVLLTFPEGEYLKGLICRVL